MTGATLALLLAVLLPLPLHADDPVTVSLRGRAQSIVRLQPAASAPHATVLFLPGDGGWRGAAVSMARNILSMGYAVYGFDTKKYLEAFSENGAALSQEQVVKTCGRLP